MKGMTPPLFIGKGLTQRYLNYMHVPFKGKNLAGPCPEKPTSHNTHYQVRLRELTEIQRPHRHTVRPPDVHSTVS